MLPPISFVESIEIIRDGGSLAAIFDGSNGANYWLLFTVEVKILPSGDWQRERYLPPVIVERQIGTAIEITWEHAKVFLNQMRPFIKGAQDQKMLEVMFTVANAQGQISYESVVDLMTRGDDPSDSLS